MKRDEHMTDDGIIMLYNSRREDAIEETSKKYGGMCYSVAYGILRSAEDAEECVNDAYLSVWQSIPPENPTSLGAYISRIVRNGALNRLRFLTAEKRGGAIQYDAAIDELAECADTSAGDIADDVALTRALDMFLTSLPPTQRMVFMRRYWYMRSVSEIAREYRLTTANVKVILHRVRKKLARYLEKEGISI